VRQLIYLAASYRIFIMSIPVKTTIARAVALSMMLIGSASVFAAATGDTYNTDITASLVDVNACVPIIQDVKDLGEVTAADIRASNSKPEKYTVLNVSFDKCVTGQKGQLAFLGTASEDDPNVLANTADTNPAQSVGIGFWQVQDGIGKTLKTTLVPVNTGTTTLENIGGGSDFHKYSIAIALVRDASPAITGGNVSATAQLQINYL
jgi:type 1 fimbria pilin